MSSHIEAYSRYVTQKTCGPITRDVWVLKDKVGDIQLKGRQEVSPSLRPVQEVLKDKVGDIQLKGRQEVSPSLRPVQEVLDPLTCMMEMPTRSCCSSFSRLSISPCALPSTRRSLAAVLCSSLISLQGPSSTWIS